MPPPGDADNDYLREYRARRVDQRPTGAYHGWLQRPGGASAYDHRVACVRRYAFAVPNHAALAAIGRYTPVVELGAGTGYWAYLLRHRGIDVVAYDLAPPDQTANPYKFEPRTWTEVRRGGVEALAHHRDRSLLLCWPGYRDGFADAALAAHRGRHLIYIGEGQGGHTADDAFFVRLAADWRQVEQVAIPQWPGVVDYLAVYRRRGDPAEPPTERAPAASAPR